MVGNRGYARFLQIAKGSVTLNEAAIAREARLDGKFVLTTSTDLPAAEIAGPTSPCGGSSAPSARSSRPSTFARSSTSATTA